MPRRFRDFDQLLSAVKKEANNRPLCLAFAPGATQLDVCWSDAVRQTGEPHDAAVNCIQALHVGRNYKWERGIVLFHTDGYSGGKMAQKMLEFVGSFPPRGVT
jgi:hypothetical protein